MEYCIELSCTRACSLIWSSGQKEKHRQREGQFQTAVDKLPCNTKQCHGDESDYVGISQLG